MANYLEILWDNKMYCQRNENSKFIEFDLNGTKLNSYEELPAEVKQIAKQMQDCEEHPEKYFYYEVIDDEVIINGIADIKATHLKVPEMIEGYKVVGVDTAIIPDDSKIIQIQFPETLEYFECASFTESPTLRYINIPQNIQTIPYHCFQNCTNICGLDLSNITSIEDYAFAGCHHISNLDLSSVKFFGDFCFQHCTNLKNVKMAEDVTTIPTGMFQACVNLTNISLPQSLEVIENSAFSHCHNLSEVDFPSSLKHIYESAFSYAGLETIKLHSKIEKIENTSFFECKSIKEILVDDLSNFSISQFGISSLDKLKVLNNEGVYVNPRNRGEER